MKQSIIIASVLLLVMFVEQGEKIHVQLASILAEISLISM